MARKKKTLPETDPCSDNICSQADLAINSGEMHSSLFGISTHVQYPNCVCSFLPQDAHEECRKENSIIYQTQQPLTIQRWLESASGERHLIIIHKQPVLNSEGVVSSIICTYQDITRQWKLERFLTIQRDLAVKLSFLSEIEPLLKEVIHHALRLDGVTGTGILIINPDGSMNLTAHDGLSEQFAEKLSYFPADSPETRLVAANQTRFIDPSALTLETAEAIKTLGFKSVLIVPIGHHNKVVAALSLGIGIELPDSNELISEAEIVASIAGGVIIRIYAEQELRQSEELYRLITENMTDLVCLHDPDGTYRYVSSSVRAILGYEPEELLGTNPYDLFHPQDRKRVKSEAHDKALSGITDNKIVYRIRHKNGKYHWYESKTIPIYNQQGEVVSLQTVTHDVHERVTTEHALRESEKRYRSVVSSMSEGIVIQDKTGKIIDFNQSALRILGLTPSQINNRDPFDLRWHSIREDGSSFPGEEHPSMYTLHSGKPLTGVVMGVRTPSGEVTWISMNSSPLFREGENTPHAVVTSFTDITNQKKSQDALFSLNEKLVTLLSSMEDLVLVLDKNDRFIDFYQAGKDVTFLPPEQFLLKNFKEINLPEKLSAKLTHAVNSVKKSDQSQQFDYSLYINGEDVWYNSRVSRVNGPHGEYDGAIFVNRNITERKKWEKELERLTMTDNLTGIANRKFFYQVLHQEISRAKRYHNPLSLIMFDIDHFKRVNDTYGHDVGDQVLKKVSATVQQNTRNIDILARWGGEEFMILCPQTNSESAACIAERIRKAAEETVFPSIDSHITLSFGVATLSDESEKDLLKRVDDALYRAKREGRNRVVRA